MIFEVVSYRGKLFGEKGNRIFNVLLETRVWKGVLCEENEAAAAKKIGLVRLEVNDCDPSLQETFSRYYFAKGTMARQVMDELLKAQDWRIQPVGVSVFVVSRMNELAEDFFAK